MLVSFFGGEFLLHIHCWFHFYLGRFSDQTFAICPAMHYLYLGSFSYTSRAGFICIWGVSLKHPMLASFLSGEFLLHIPSSFHFFLGNFSYTSHAGFIFIWGVSLAHPMLVSFLSGEFFGSEVCNLPSYALSLSGEFLLHIPCWLYLYLWSFSYISHAGFIFICGVSLTHPMLVSFLSGEFLLHIPCWFHFYLGVSLTHPVLALFDSGEFLLHIPCWLHFYLGSFSYTSHAGFTFIWGVSLTHPMLVSFLCGEFHLHIPC